MSSFTAVGKSLSEQNIFVGIPIVRDDLDVMSQCVKLKIVRYLIKDTLMLSGFLEAFERNVINEIAY